MNIEMLKDDLTGITAPAEEWSEAYKEYLVRANIFYDYANLPTFRQGLTKVEELK